MRTIENCPACCADEATIVAALDDSERIARFHAFSQAKYGGLLDDWLNDVPPIVLRCSQCGHCWYNNQPSFEQINQMYATGRRLLPEVRLSREPSAPMNNEMARLRRLIPQSPQLPSLLDYGSGYGRWARAAVMAGFEVTAYEPAVTRGGEEGALDFEVIHDPTLLDARQFDAINLEQVLEHVPDPYATLTQIRKMCVPDAVVRITVPNLLRSPEGKLLWHEWPFDGSRIHTMAPFEHLHGFTPRSLFQLIGRAGFQMLAVRRLAINYPGTLLRNMIGKVWPRMGQTLALVQLRP